jgi:cytochrome P450
MIPPSTNVAPLTGASPAAPQPPPSSGVLDLMRLGSDVLVECARHPLEFSLEAVFRVWAKRTAARLQSENLVVNLGVKKLLLVGSPELSRYILSQFPSRGGFSTGSLKRSAMTFLAVRALTISDDDDWRRRRAFNEAVLEPDRPHEFERDFVRATLKAFAPPVASAAELRAAMGRTMAAIVFGSQAPPRLVDDIEKLFELVQNPVKRVLTAPWAYLRRGRFYDALRMVWMAPDLGVDPSLLLIARHEAAQLDSTELLEQIPHWMFTFTGSATDLLTRALALISSDPAVRVRVLAEIQAEGPLDDGCNVAALPFLEGCLMEAAHLYPPVTRTFRCALAGVTVGNVRIPPGMEIMQLFPPLLADNFEVDTRSRSFNPDRWMRAERPVCSFDPFLGGVRRCPGQSLILLVLKVALASLLVQQRLVIDAPGMGTGSLPAVFPRRGLRFHAA